MDQTSVRAVFVFDGGDLSVHESLSAAGGDVEAIDVENHKYDFYGDDGTIITASVERQVVRLAPTGERRLGELQTRLGRFLAAVDAPEEIRSSTDVLAVAQYIIDRDWESQWPRRPRWLARSLRREGPPRIQRT